MSGANGSADNRHRAKVAADIASIEKRLSGKQFPPPVETKEPPEPASPYRAFPLDCLPHVVCDFCDQGAKAVAADPAYLALPALAVLGSCIGNTRVIELRRDWHEPAVVFAVAVGYSGTTKSSAAVLPVRHLFEVQKRLLADHKKEKLEWGDAKAVHDYRQKKGLPSTTRLAEAPVPRKVICGDVTIEKLAVILSGNPRGVLLWRDELSGWFGSFCRYRDAKDTSTDLPHWLEFHRAGTIMVDRKAGDLSLFIQRAAVCVTGTIQPVTLQKVLTEEFMETGLGARLLLAMPDRRQKVWTDVSIHPDIDEAYKNLLDALLALPLLLGRDGELRPQSVTMAADAEAEWVRFYNALGRDQAIATGDWAATLAKLEGYAARFALIHHVSNQPYTDTPPISLSSIEAGIALSEWFTYEVRRVLEWSLSSDDERITNELRATVKSAGGRISVRDLRRSSTRYRTIVAAEAALQALVDAGAGSWEPIDLGRRGRRSKIFLARAAESALGDEHAEMNDTS